MDHNEALAKLRATIGEVTQVQLDNTSVDEDLVAFLGLDSLGGLRMLAAIEKRFDICFPDEELGKLKTLDTLARSIVVLDGEKPL